MVSIIIPCFNQGQYLQDSLESVLSQTYKNWECIIVNDGSEDNTEDVALKFCNADSRFSYHSQKNMGVSSARNNGISKSRGEYILPLDSDDKIGSRYLELAISYFESHPDTKLVYFNACFFGDKDGVWNLPKYDYNTLIWSNPIYCSALYRRSDYDATGGYDEKIAGLEDWDFWLSFLKREDVVYKIQEEYFYYRIHEAFDSRNRCANQKIKETYEYIVSKHKSIYEPFYKEILFSKMIIQEQSDEISRLSNSRAYRLGNVILRPCFRNIKKLFVR